VRFSGHGLRDVVHCHCSQCRRAHGTVAAYSATPLEDFAIEVGESLRWFDASPRARRGFCANCGSTLFWAPRDADTIGVSAGAIDSGPAVRSCARIYTADSTRYAAMGNRLRNYPGSMDETED